MFAFACTGQCISQKIGGSPLPGFIQYWKKKRKHMPYDLYVNKKKQQILQELPNITMQSIRQLST